MTHGSYRLREYTAGDLDEVARLQRYLLGEDVGLNAAYLRWKYHDNPQGDRPWAIVAEHPDDGIVGFRGFIPSLWEQGAGGPTLPLLALADTCVDAGHRRQGLFEGMTRLALERFADSGFQAVINLSTSPRPAPGYIKMGWEVFAHHGQVVRTTPRGLWSRLTGRRTPGPAVAAGRRDGFEWSIESEPRPREMAAVVAAATEPGDHFRLRRDEEFYSWRYGNIRERYSFAYARRDGGLAAFVAVRGESAPGAGAVVDHAERVPQGVAVLADRLLASGRFGILSVWDVRPLGPAGEAWRRRGFRSLDGLKRLAGQTRPPMPLLIRPLKPQVVAGDWVRHGRDLRERSSWNITEICSDGS